jgi:hypothetical protein
MIRAALLVPALAVCLAGCSQNAPPDAVAEKAPPTPPALTPPPAPADVRRPVAVAPMPRPAGEPFLGDIDLTEIDPGLDFDITAAIPEVDRIDVNVDAVVVPDDSIGIPDVPGLPLAQLPPAGLDAPGIAGDTGGVLAGGAGFGAASDFSSGFQGRSGATKDRFIRTSGANADSERAVALGLAWLAKQQRLDGGWEYDGTAKEKRVAATGMALLAFLGAGETHTKARKYKKTVEMGVKFLLKECPVSGPNSGRLSTDAYAQAIATMALCEAYGMTGDGALLQVAAQAAVNYIQSAQGPDGSWGYSFRSAGDTSITGWQIQALKAARLAKLAVEDKVLARAVKFLDTAGKGELKAEYGYRDSTNPSPALSAVGLLCRYYIDGWAPENPRMIDGVALLLKNRPPAPGPQVPEMYYHYYATQLMFFYGGEAWKDWNEGPLKDGKRTGGMRDWLIKTQAKEGKDAGSWEPCPGSIGPNCGRVGTTAMAVLTLEVYYRHLPLYKRMGEGDDALKDLGIIKEKK